MRRGLSPDALRGVRIGVMRFASGFGTDAAFEEALATLRAQGAMLVEIAEFPSRPEIGRNELVVLLAELKHDLNAYLATLPAAVATRTLAQLIAFNRAHAETEMALFGQDLFERAEATGGLDDEWRQARDTSLRLAGAEGIDRLLSEHELAALVGPTRSGGLADRRGARRPEPGRRRRRAGRSRGLSAPHRANGPGARPAGRPLLHRPEMVGRARPRARLRL